MCDLCAVLGVQINMGMRSHILCILEMASLSLKTIWPISMIVPMLWSRVKKIRYIHVQNLQQLYGELMDYSMVVAATTDFFLRWSSSPFKIIQMLLGCI